MWTSDGLPWSCRLRCCFHNSTPRTFTEGTFKPSRQLRRFLGPKDRAQIANRTVYVDCESERGNEGIRHHRTCWEGSSRAMAGRSIHR